MPDLDTIAERLGVDLVALQAQLYDAAAIATAAARRPWARGIVSVDPARPALVAGIARDNVVDVAAFIEQAWGEPTVLRVLADDRDASETTLTVGELVSVMVDHLGAGDFVVWVPAADPYENGIGPETLARIIARLRAPGGCPWDQKQTTESLREDLLNEAYEVVTAIDNGDDANLAEELGDVLMAVVLQAQVAEDEGRFSLADVYAAVNAKMIRRHPHVFGDVHVESTDDVVANWQQIKAAEKSEATGEPLVTDPLAHYPLSMPATLVAVQLARRAHQYGIDQPVDSDQLQARSSTLLDAVMASIRAGADPDVELRDALRREMASVAGPS